LILLALFSHNIYKDFNHFNHGIDSGLDGPDRKQAPAGRILMAAANGTILNSLTNALDWADALLPRRSSYLQTPQLGFSRSRYPPSAFPELRTRYGKGACQIK